MPTTKMQQTRGGTRRLTAAQAAFEKSGRSYAEVARAIRVGKEDTVKRILRDGTPCYETAFRISRAIHCDIILLLPRIKPAAKIPAKKQQTAAYQSGLANRPNGEVSARRAAIRRAKEEEPGCANTQAPDTRNLGKPT